VAIAVPATLVGVLLAAVLSYRRGAELADDPIFQQRVRDRLVDAIPQRTDRGTGAAGSVSGGAAPGHGRAAGVRVAEKAAVTIPTGVRAGAGRISAAIFLIGVASIIVLGAFDELWPTFTDDAGVVAPLSMALTIQITMLAIAAIIVLVCRVNVEAIPRAATARSGFVALVGIFGLAWLGQTLIDANIETVVGGLSDMVTAAPWTFAIGLFLASVLLFSQAATTTAILPVGLALGLGGPALAAMWPAVNGYFFLPTYGTIIAAVSFDRSGTTRIGRFVLNHSFMVPGLVATFGAVGVGLVIAQLL
jgi:anaerobic C4-dicarboxylate transporter DcuA